MKFKLKGHALIKHLNTRKEGEEDAQELAIDIKLSAQKQAADDVLPFFCPDSPELLKQFLYLDGGAVRNTLMRPVGYILEVRNCTLTAIGSTFYGVDVKKFELTPRDSFIVDMEFQVSLLPSADEIARFAEFLREEIDIDIEAPQELDLALPAQ